MLTADRRLTVTDPATGGVIADCPVLTTAEAPALVARARRAQREWARAHPADRGAALREAAGRIAAQADRIVDLAVREGGRPHREARAGLDAAIGAFLQAAELGPLHGGRTLCGAHDALDLTIREPRGVVAVICPWNDPLAIAANGLAAGLATGNAVVVKPSEHTPLATAAMVAAAGLPGDVAQVAQGAGETGRCLVDLADAVVFTGSVAAGRDVATRCGGRLRPAVLELGGKDPLIVDAGTDPGWAADMAAAGAFANAGQVCTSVERIYVHRDVADAFTAALVDRARGMVVGDPFDDATTMGPMAHRAQRDIVTAQLRDAVAAGARVLCGGRAVPGDGAYHEATVVADADDRMPLMRDETFGPVAAIRVVRDFDEALVRAAASPYGLAATVLTGDMRHANRAVRELPVGTVKVNAVWGGAPGGSAEPRGISGMGLGYGPGLLDALTAPKVAHVTPPPA